MRKFVIIAALAGLWLTAACAAAGSADDATPTPMPTAVRPTFTVQRGDIVVDVTVGGRVVPVESKPASFATDGTVGTVYVQVGDYVDKGQLLADLAALKDLEAQWAKVSAQAAYEQTLSNDTIQRAQIKLQIAQLTLDDLKRRRASQDQIQVATLQVQLAQMDLDETKADPSLHTAADQAAQLQQQMADAQLKAPLAGYIVGVSNTGQSVRAGASAFEIGDITHLELSALAKDEDLKQLAAGMPVTATLPDPGAKPLTGVIRELPYPYGSGTDSGMVRITLSLAPDKAGYKLGDQMAVRVEVQHRRGVLWLPPDAIRNLAGRTFVVLDTGDQPRVDIKLGVQTPDQDEVTSGLTEGQVVVGP